MARLYLFAEGQTEQTFADEVLRPHLANFGVYMHNPVLIAHARKKGRVHRGGGRRYEPMKNDIVRFLRQESGDDTFFTRDIQGDTLDGGDGTDRGYVDGWDTWTSLEEVFRY